MQKKMKAVTFFAVAFALCSAAMAEDVVVNWVTGNVGNYTEFPAEGWTKSDAGVAELAGDAGAKYVTFESAYDDPLFFAPTSGSASKLVSVEWSIQLFGGDMEPSVAIEGMGPAITATTPEDESDDTPAQWYGYALTNSVEAGWVKLFGNVPSNEVWYTVRIEQGMVAGVRMIRYSVKPEGADVFTVLKDEQQHEWFADPRGDGAGLTSANFVGCGAFGNFKIDNIWFNKGALAGSDVAGFDWTNATVTVTVGDSYVADDKSPITLELKVYDAAGTQVGTYEADLETDSGKGKGTFDVGNLTPGGNYSYEVVAKVGDVEVASFARNGNLVSANNVEWIYENSTGNFGGAFDPVPVWNGGVAQLSDAVFAVEVPQQKEASNRLVRIENTLMGSELCDDLGILEDYDLSVIQGAMLAYVDPETGEASWLGVVDGDWVPLTGAAPVANQKYVVRVDFDFTLAEPKVRYSVSADDGVSFETLHYEDAEWLAIASEVAAGKTVTAIELPGSCSFYGMKGDYYDAAVAEVGGTKYYTLEAALEAANGSDQQVKLLTNLTYLPGGFDGTWTIAENGKTLQILTPEDGYTYTYTEGTEGTEHTLKVDAQGMCVQNLTTGYQHLNLKAAQARAEDGDVLQLLDNVGAAALAIEKSLTLDLHGFSVTNDAANTQLFVLTNNVTLTLAGAGALTNGIDVWAGSRLALSNNFAAASESVVALELKGEWAHEDVIAEGVSETQAAMLAITPEKIDSPAAGNGKVEYRAEDDGKFVWAEIPPSAKLAFARTDGYDLTNLTVTVTLSEVAGDLSKVVIDLYNEDGTLAKRTAVGYEVGTLVYPIVLDGYTKGTRYTFNAYVLGGDSEDVVGGGAVAGSFYAGANGQIWFRAKPDDILNGAWEEAPEVDGDDRYVLDGDEYVFTPTTPSPSNAFVTVDWQVSFDRAADEDLALDVGGEGAFSLFAGAEPETYVWKGWGNGAWVTLTNAVAARPDDYLVHADFDYTDSASPKVSYALIVDGRLYRFADPEGNVWFTVADSAGQIASVSAVGEGKLDVVEGFWSINAVAAIGDEFFATIDAAAAAGKDDANKVITLLTNVTWAPTEGGTYYFDLNGFTVQATDNVTWSGTVATVSGGEIVIDELGVEIAVDTSFLKEQVPWLPADATPTQVAAALAEPGANGYKLYESYVLGLDPKDEFSKPVLVDELSAEADKVDVQVLNVSVNAKAGVEVTYSLLSDTDPEFKSGEESAPQAEGRFEVPLPGEGESVKYYKVNFYFSNPAPAPAD